MAKTPSQKLFRLIHALSPSEKRYFKVIAGASSKGDKKFLRLFDAIEKQEKLDEEALREAIYGTAKVETKKFSELKNYLYEFILKALHGYDEQTSVDFQLKHFLKHIRVLFRRSMFEEAKEMIEKAKPVAVRYEEFTVLIELLRWEKLIAYTMIDVAYLNTHLQHIEAQEKEYIEALTNFMAYRNVFYTIYLFLRKNDVVRSHNDALRLKAIIDTPIFETIDNAKSHKARLLFYRIYSLYYYSLTKFDKFHLNTKALIALMEERPDFVKEDLNEYIVALNNHITSSIWVKVYDEAEENLEKLYQIKPNTADEALKIHRQYYLNKFLIAMNTGAFEKGVRNIEQHFKDLEQFNKQTFERSLFFYSYFYLYFGAGKYSEALDYLNKWTNLSNTIERKDLQSLGRILTLIIHFEMKNMTLLESLIRSTYRFLSTQNVLFEFERKILQCMREALNAPNTRQQKVIFTTLKADLEVLAENINESVFLKQFDFLAWIESKITGHGFGAIIRGK
jgi:tetratricopeptide (TPR) repeat protein